MKLAASVGVGFVEWLEMTPGELSLWFRQVRSDELERQRIREANIYSLAALIRSAVWAKEMPSFSRVFGERAGNGAGKASKEMTDAEMFEQVKLLNKLFGGTEE